MAEAVFMLSAGFGTRFQPQTNFLPKPAIPLFNIPQALYSATLLKNAGVKEFFYNSHHLPNELNKALRPFFHRDGIFEAEILDSAGGIANAKPSLERYENFWVANGDSFIKQHDPEVLQKAYDFHIKTKSLATLIAIPKTNLALNGLVVNKDNILTHTSKEHDSLHFVGLYIFNKEIFNLIEPVKSHILKDVLLKTDLKVSVFNAGKGLTWFETGNEADFISCCKMEASEISHKKDCSTVVQTLKSWDISFENDLENFLNGKVWTPHKEFKTKSDFLILPEKYSGETNHLENSVVIDLDNIPAGQKFKERVLINSSQWT